MKNVRLENILIASLALLVVACSQSSKETVQIPDGYILFKAGDAFQFYGPPDLKYEPKQGVDSFVGGFASDRYALQFDFGLYSSNLSEWNGTRTQHIINGKKAEIVKIDNSIGVTFPSLKESGIGPLKLTFYANCDKKYFDEIEKIFNTISFPD